MKRNLLALSMLFVLVLSFIGCSKPIIPFEKSPEDGLILDIITQSEKNAEERIEMFKQYDHFLTLGKMPDDLRTKLEAWKTEKTPEVYEKDMAEFVAQGQFLFLANANLEFPKTQESLDKTNALIMNPIKAYIAKFYTGEEQPKLYVNEGFLYLKPFEAADSYMTKNKITVTEIVYPEIYDSRESWNYPLMFTVTYVVKGTVGDKPFEKEICQDFFVGEKGSNGIEVYGVRTHMVKY